MPKHTSLRLTKRKTVGIVAVAGVMLLVGGGFTAWKLFAQKAPTQPTKQTTKKRINDPVNVIAVDERPYLRIIPAASGRNVIISVQELKKQATTVEYELEYQAGSLLQGAFGAIELAQLPKTTDILLGSCSAGGACTYHEDVRGGTLLLRFAGSETFALKSEWKYIDNKAKETALSSKDAKFQLTAPELAKVRYVVVYNTPGYPGKLPGTLISDVYALATASPVSGQLTLVLRAAEEVPQAKIVGWDGKTWKTFESKVDGKQVTATVPALEAYAVVK